MVNKKLSNIDFDTSKPGKAIIHIEADSMEEIQLYLKNIFRITDSKTIAELMDGKLVHTHLSVSDFKI